MSGHTRNNPGCGYRRRARGSPSLTVHGCPSSPHHRCVCAADPQYGSHVPHVRRKAATRSHGGRYGYPLQLPTAIRGTRRAKRSCTCAHAMVPFIQAAALRSAVHSADARARISCSAAQPGRCVRRKYSFSGSWPHGRARHAQPPRQRGTSRGGFVRGASARLCG